MPPRTSLRTTLDNLWNAVPGPVRGLAAIVATAGFIMWLDVRDIKTQLAVVVEAQTEVHICNRISKCDGMTFGSREHILDLKAELKILSGTTHDLRARLINIEQILSKKGMEGMK